MVRAAWLYHVGGFNQEETAAQLGLTRARVNRLLSEAREQGLVTISVDHELVGMLPVEDRIREHFGLDFCRATPAFGLGAAPAAGEAFSEARSRISIRAVGLASANFLRAKLAAMDAPTIGVGWGRTIEQMGLQLGSVRARKARFISLMGSLTANSSSNPFEVVQALARRTGAEGYVLPVPFIADTVADKEVFLSQRPVSRALAIARSASLCMISVGELTEAALLRRQGMLSRNDLESLRAAGAVGDTNGIFFDNSGRPVDHELNSRTLAVPFETLRELPVVLMVGGIEKIAAAAALLQSGIVNGLIIDGDTALALGDRIAAAEDRLPNDPRS
ncbi:sugar-binding domain-containing protein [Inquilinus sp. CAU 1745]|uniref:sugar-binding transcriptional regulator n=1 Tax=Inquilinus sp. CAU 1745 TaxID=3140369 RepID=UPI00325BD5D9